MKVCYLSWWVSWWCIWRRRPPPPLRRKLVSSVRRRMHRFSRFNVHLLFSLKVVENIRFRRIVSVQRIRKLEDVEVVAEVTKEVIVVNAKVCVKKVRRSVTFILSTLKLNIYIWPEIRTLNVFHIIIF